MSARLDPFAELALRVKDVARREAERVRPRTLRFKVVKVAPRLRLDQLDGDLVLEEGDDDLEIADAVDTAAPEVGDVVRVHEDEDGEYLAFAIVKRGNDG